MISKGPMIMPTTDKMRSLRSRMGMSQLDNPTPETPAAETPESEKKLSIDNVKVIDGKVSARFVTETDNQNSGEYIPPKTEDKIFDDFSQFSDYAEDFFGLAKNESVEGPEPAGEPAAEDTNPDSVDNSPSGLTA